MSVGHLLPTDGVTGGLWLGALVDAGADVDRMQAAVAGLGIGQVELSAEPVAVDEIAATRVAVRIADGAPRLPGWEDLRDVLEAADLDQEVRERALGVARRLIEAEAAVHRTAPDQVRLHELGDPDTVVEIVATIAGLRALGVQRLTCGPVALGSGTVNTAHGTLSVPPPAVVELLHGVVVHAGHRDGELTTPTGAALVAELATPVDGTPPLRLTGRGRGAVGDPGARDARVLTLLLGDDAWSRVPEAR